MIDLKTETRLSLSQAARLIPPTRQEKPVHVSTLTRWILRGVRGVKLEAVRIGGRWVTTLEAVERFSTACTAKLIASPGQPDVTSKPSDAAFLRHQEQVAQELTALGV